MTSWYKRVWFTEGWALGLCTVPCASSATGPPAYIMMWATDHAARHRPGGMLLTDYGRRAGF